MEAGITFEQNLDNFLKLKSKMQTLYNTYSSVLFNLLHTIF